MVEQVKWHPSQRVDLEDLKRGTVTYTQDKFRHALMKLLQGQEPSGAIIDGFYIEVPDQSANPGQIRVVNGYALDRICEAVFKAPGTTTTIENLFEDPNVAREITLPGSSTEHRVEVEFVAVDGEDDARGFWDATFDNGADPSGDVRPDGREVAFSVPTRQFPDWRIITTSGAAGTAFSWEGDLGTEGSTRRFPLARIVLTAGGLVDNDTETARSTVLATPTADKNVRTHNVRLFQDTDRVSFYSKAGVIRNGGGQTVWPITSIDYVNNVVVLADDPVAAAAGIVATDAIVVVSADSGVPREFIEEYRGANAGTYTPTAGSHDVRSKFFSESEIETAIDPEAYVANYADDAPSSTTAVNSSTVAGPGAKAIADGPFRTDARLHSLRGMVRALMFVISEMKHGPDFAATQDGSTDYLIESWAGTHAVSEDAADTDNAPVGSLGEVGNARLHYPLGDSTQRVQHDTLREHLSAIRGHTITVGADSDQPGDFTGAQGLANAMQHIYDNHDTGFGTLYIRAGSYDLSGVTYTALPDALKLPHGWSVIGEFQGGVEILVPFDKQFVVEIGAAAGAAETIGQRVSDITFVSAGAVARTASMVVFVADTANLDTTGLGRALGTVQNCTFLNEYGVTGAGTFRGMVRVAGTAAGDIQQRVLKFKDCTLAVDSAAAQKTFEWSSLDVDAGAVANLGLPWCNFDGCTFLTVDAASVNHGCYFDPGGALDTDYHHAFRGCVFHGGGVQTLITGSSWIVVGDDTDVIIYMDVQACTFASIIASGAKVGGGIQFDNTDGTLTVAGSTFRWLQWGVVAKNGRESITGNTFNSCAAGVVVGDDADATCMNKVDISGNVFTGEVSKATKALGNDLQAAQTVGVLLNRTTPIHAYGTEDVTSADPGVATTVKIAGNNFTEIGCGINAAPLQGYISGLGDNGTLVALLEITGNNFYGIPGPAIDTGFINSGIANLDTLRRAPIDSMIINGNTFQWCSFRILPDAFASAQGAAYPVTEIGLTHQNCVSTCAHRVFVTNNTFNLIGYAGYATGSGQYSYTTAYSRRFLSVLGNDPYVATRTVVVKGNTFVGFSNEKDIADTSVSVDPWDLTLTTDGTTEGQKHQSWAGCFWVAEMDATDRDDGVQVVISDNTITGDYRAGVVGSYQKSSDSVGQNGFYIGGLYDVASTGTLKFTNNDFSFHQGQHGLYVAGTSSPGVGGVSFNEMIIRGNSIKSFSAGTSTAYKAGYPTETQHGRIELIRLANWNGRATYLVDAAGTVDGPQTADEAMVMPTIHASNNFFHIEGYAPQATASTDLLDGRRSGILMAVGDSPNSPNAVFQGNVFKNCSLTLGESTTFGDVAYKYVVTGNVFAGHLPTGSGDAGHFRGLFCHNHVHGETDAGGAGNWLPQDRVSVLKFSENSVHNGTAVLRAGNSNADGWADPVIGYVLMLTSNSFYGRGGGLNNSDPGYSSPASDEDRTIKSCFDCLGGKGLTDTTAAIGGTANLDTTWDSSERDENKVIFVAFNLFPPNVGNNNCMLASDDTTLLPVKAAAGHTGKTTLAGLATGTTEVGAVIGTQDMLGFVIAGNLQMASNSAGGGAPETFNVAGSH